MDIEAKLQELRRRGEGAHMAHVYYGDPSEAFSEALIRTLAENGADIIELGIPFSDPIADGPVFQASCERALTGGVTPGKCIRGIRRLRHSGLKAPIVVTTYFNIPYVMGLESFMEELGGAGAQAVIVPDLPVEEAEPILENAENAGLHLILQVAPTTSGRRLRKILENASGFIYLIGVEGVTGARVDLQAVSRLIKAVKEETKVPVIVGFGVSERGDAKALVSAGADGVAVGSAYTRIYSESLQDPYRKLPEVARLAREIKSGCLAGHSIKAE
jgi:tryptophan synthase alpha chain